jgi:23S rRNA pseudouridine1911/1915/1917 synthase
MRPVDTYLAPPDLEGALAHLDEDGNPRIVERRFTVEEAFHGFRVDHYLKRKIPRLSRTKLQEIVRTQLSRGDGRRLKPHSPVAFGDQLIIRRPARPEPPCPRRFDVLYGDDDMLVIDKPAGLPVHVSAKFYFNTLTRVLAERFPGQPLQICHRLDRETSGCLVVARHRDAAARLKAAFSDKRARKTYLALIHGIPAWEEREIDLPLGLVDAARCRIGVRMEVRANALPALTRARVIDRAGQVALVECRPITGRQHQIRAHLAAVGHPIVGDKLYAHGDHAFADYCERGLTPDLLARFGLPRHALHAASITVPHPAHGGPISVDSPLPGELRQFFYSQTMANGSRA